jgi:hypothetical protein
MIKVSPEAPTDGMNSKQSKEGGQIFFIELLSNTSFLVSCRQIISQAVLEILLLIAVSLG